MEYDYSKLINDIARAMEGIIEVFKDFCDRLKPRAKQILEFLESLEDYKLTNRIKHSPVREIRADKIRLMDRRLNRYYCRSNC